MNTDCLAAGSPRTDCGEQDEPGSSAQGDPPPQRRVRPAGESHDALIDLDAGTLPAADADALRGDLSRIVPMLGRPVARLAVRIVQDSEMTAMHRKWRDLDGTTDVLTFEHAPDGPIDVDIAVCLDEANRRCADCPHGTTDELLLYIVHGLLHCCGHDDHDPDRFNTMHAEEDRLLEAVGRGPIFRLGGDAP